MSIFCVSDLHLADRGFRDNFAVEGREARFHKFLDYVAAEGGQLYVLGDLFDFWRRQSEPDRCGLPGPAHATGQDASSLCRGQP